MTKYEEKKIIEAIADCDRYINREESRAADLRPAEIQKRLDWYKQHKAKLHGMLAC